MEQQLRFLVLVPVVGRRRSVQIVCGGAQLFAARTAGCISTMECDYQARV